jgi:hypothetical protein
MPGTIESVNIFGNTYNVMAEADATFMGGTKEVTPIAHTGGSTPKRVRRTESVTGLILHVNEDENDQLKAANDSAEIGTLSIETADGRRYRAQGFISHNGWTNQENAATVDLHPVGIDGWTLF